MKKSRSFFGEVRPDKGLHTLLDATQAMHSRGLPARALVISTIGTHQHGLNDYEREMMARMAAGTREGWAMLARRNRPSVPPKSFKPPTWPRSPSPWERPKIAAA